MNLKPHIEKACDQIAPLWPLSNFVAVNPFLGFSDRSFTHTAHYLMQVKDAQMTMPLEWYERKFTSKETTREDLAVAVERAPNSIRKAFDEAGLELTPEYLLESSGAESADPETQYRPGAFSAYLDAREGTHWQNCIREEAAKWCAAYFDRGQSNWRFPFREENFYSAWRKAVRHDRNLACAGLPGAHKVLADMPASPELAIDHAASCMSVPETLMTEWLYRVLLVLPGWAGHLRYRDREVELKGGHGTDLMQLLAILLNYERLLHQRFTVDEDCLLGWKRILMEEPVELANDILPLELAQRLVWQGALEHRIESQLRDAIDPHADHSLEKQRPAIQAAFCIDVRSELFRRNLETALPDIQTIGFAGFFGIPLRHQSFGHLQEESRCPALLAPVVASGEHGHEKHARIQGQEKAWKQFREGGASCFSFVETFGLGYAWNLLRSALGGTETPAGSLNEPKLADAPALKTKVSLAKEILKGLTLTKHCAPLVLLCGHGSSTRNNPYASGLDCGACGGHSGDVNARIAATLLNDPSVRQGLAGNGISIPGDTVFIAGLHNTTTDEVTLYDLDQIPDTHQVFIQSLQQGLAQAGLLSATSRARSLDSQNANAGEAVRARSRDWSQVRPEWGLAGNAGFLIAPRSWTRHANLDGAAFLHEYDPPADPEGLLLESIMAGPLVVGSWINLQYYASVTDNARFGSGHKAIHNVVGGLGVALGNESDLRPGLPLQSLHDGQRLVHEPARLHAMVAADPDVIDAILHRRPEMATLVKNEWIHLFALGSDGTLLNRRKPDGTWEELSSRPTLVGE